MLGTSNAWWVVRSIDPSTQHILLKIVEFQNYSGYSRQKVLGVNGKKKDFPSYIQNYWCQKFDSCDIVQFGMYVWCVNFKEAHGKLHISADFVRNVASFAKFPGYM